MVCGTTRNVVAFSLVALLAIPGYAAQATNGELNQEILAQPGTDITFYGHVFGYADGNANPEPMPMNTQYPENEADLSTGYSGGCGNPPPLPDDSADCETYGLNSMYWYTTAGFVQVKQANEFAYDKLHNERGQTKDIYLDTSKPIVGTMYMSADFHGWSTSFRDVGVGWNWDPGYYQDWAVEMWVWHANLGPWSSDPSAKPDVGLIKSRDPSITPIAHGMSDPVDMWSLDPNLQPVPNAQQTVWPFTAQLEWNEDFVAAGAVVPYLNDLVVEFKWYQVTDGQKYIISPSWQVGGLTWNVNAGEDYPNNIVLPVRNPLDVELVYPRFVHDKLVVLSVLNTPWGSYDVDLDSIDFEVRDGNGIEVVPDPALFQSLVERSVAHNGHYDPINITYIWDYQAQGLKAGDYTITIGADNFQKSFHTETVASFTIAKDGSGKDATAGQSGILTLGGDFEPVDEEPTDDGSGAGTDTDDSESKGSPGPATALLALALLGAALVSRRRSA